MAELAQITVPYNEVRLRPDGGAIAWHRREIEDDDAQPWLVIEQDSMDGVEHIWLPPEQVTDWTVLAPAAHATTSTLASPTPDVKAVRHG